MIYFFIIIAIVITVRRFFTFQIRTDRTHDDFDSSGSLGDEIQDADFEEIN